MNTDITALLYSIKENIRKIEGGDTSESLLDAVCSDFLEFIELAKLFLISERDSYYGYFMMNMQFRVDFYSDNIAGIMLNEFPPVFVANPLLLCKFTLKEILYIVCHEIDHVVLNHPTEMIKANPEGNQDVYYRFNLAADASVNDRINHEVVAEKHAFLSEPDGLITSQVLSEMFELGKIKEMENYAYYYGLIKKKQIKKDENGSGILQNGQQSIMDKQNQKDGANASQPGVKSDETGGEENGGGSGKDNGKESGEGSSGKQIVTAANWGNKLTDHNWKAGEDPEEATATVREFVNASVEMMNSETRGLMPGFFMSQVEEINKPAALSWQAILKKYVGTITANKRKTRMRLNRRQPERFDLSGSIDNKVLKIVVAIDTSGSMSDRMIGEVMNEIFAILAKRNHDITIIECDAEVNRVYKAKTPADVKKKVLGRGGTCFTPVIEYINDDKYFRDALLIFFTDGFGENSIPKPRTYRNLWVVFHDERNLSVQKPYGVVLKL